MGGSSFLFTCLAIGIILSVARNVEQLEAPAAEGKEKKPAEKKAKEETESEEEEEKAEATKKPKAKKKEKEKEKVETTEEKAAKLAALKPLTDIAMNDLTQGK
jgi:cell division protein FtsW